MSDTAEQLLQALHDSEINGSLSWLFDGVFAWKLGNEASGTAGSAAEALDALRRAALKHYPNSEFALRRP